MPGIIVDDLHPRILEHAVILRVKMRGDDLRDQRLDVADHDAFDRGVQHERAGRDTGAAADDQHRARIRVQQRGNVAEHALQPHVLDDARGLRLAADVEEARPARSFSHRDRRVHSFALIDRPRAVIGCGHLAAIRHELPR